MHAQDQKQQFTNAQQAVQPAALPTFSNKPIKDRFTATQWLQKSYYNTKQELTGQTDNPLHTSGML